MPYAVCSAGWPPMPMPSSTRPGARSATVATMRASTAGCRFMTLLTKLPTWMRSRGRRGGGERGPALEHRVVEPATTHEVVPRPRRRVSRGLDPSRRIEPPSGVHPDGRQVDPDRDGRTGTRERPQAPASEVAAPSATSIMRSVAASSSSGDTCTRLGGPGVGRAVHDGQHTRCTNDRPTRRLTGREVEQRCRLHLEGEHPAPPPSLRVGLVGVVEREHVDGRDQTHMGLDVTATSGIDQRPRAARSPLRARTGRRRDTYAWRRRLARRPWR